MRRTDPDLLGGEANLVVSLLHEVLAVDRLALAVDLPHLGGEGLFPEAPLLSLLSDPLLVLRAGSLAGLGGDHVGLGRQAWRGHDAGPGGLDVTNLLVIQVSAQPAGLVPQEVLVGLDLHTLTVSVDSQAVPSTDHSVHSVLVAGHVGSLVGVEVLLLLGELSLLPLDLPGLLLLPDLLGGLLVLPVLLLLLNFLPLLVVLLLDVGLLFTINLDNGLLVAGAAGNLQLVLMVVDGHLHCLPGGFLLDRHLYSG